MSEETKPNDKRDINDLYNAFKNADSVIMKKYLHNLDEMPIVQASEAIEKLKEGSNFSLFKIKTIVYDKNENNIDKLTTVYNSLSSYKTASIIVLLNGKKDSVDLYMGSVCRKIDVREDKNDLTEDKNGESKDADNNIKKEYICSVTQRENQKKTLEKTFSSNFIGSEVDGDYAPEPRRKDEHSDDDLAKQQKEKYAEKNNIHILNQLFENKKAVSALTGVPAIRNDKINDNKQYIQGIEKFIDSMKGEEYSVIFLADVLDNERIDYMCAQYEDLYAQLYPFSKSEQTLNSSEQKGEVESLITGVTDTTNESISNATSKGTTSGTFSSHTVGGGVNFGVSADYHYTKGKNESESEQKTDTTTTGTAKSLTEQNSVSKSLTKGSGEAIQISYVNRAVKTLLDKIDEHIKRLRSFEDVGVFDCGVYFLAENSSISISAATKYKALMRGENSSIEGSAINTWENDSKSTQTDKKDADVIFSYLKKLYHPMFIMNYKKNEDKEKRIFVSPTTMMSGKELAVELALPKKSVAGLPVIECAEFGRAVVSYDSNYSGDLDIGKIYHMHHEENTPVKLDRNSLASHTFITGSTGAGKSNTVFKILKEATKYDKVKYLVVEPAKGEYKDVLGGREDVTVYGTNPNITKLLKINPFSFPDDILVSEHIDRLVEIFNVCWPMYAAMPAILKDAVIRAYESCGWDIDTSENRYRIFPNFTDVLREIRNVLAESEYSADNKGDYTGALVARIKSLTNGINGQIFSGEEVSGADLFEKNVIVDLSRVGSTETKSLIMGLLVMKLQEYRISEGKPGNSDLKHITVLEEAHNLLKRTSTEQSSETANLLGKSVELIANSIAELRSFGEGFIIADQSPGLLDMSVIRNTNTKIIHRLPDFSDRELVGKAASLNDEQIIELAKLPVGVAAVYQNDWISPVLCKVEKNKDDDNENEGNTEEKKKNNRNLVAHPNVHKAMIDIIIRPNEYIKLKDEEICRSSISGRTHYMFEKYIDNPKKKDLKSQARLIFSIAIDCGYIPISQNIASPENINKTLMNFIGDIVSDYNELEKQQLIALILKGQAERDIDMIQIYNQYVDSIKEV